MGDDINGSDDEPPSSFSPARRRKDKTSCLINENDVIDDVEEEESLYSAGDESDGGAADTENEVGSDTGHFDIDAEFDILFPPTPSRRKRRRLSSPSAPHQVLHRPTEVDQIYSASDTSQPASPAVLASPEHISRSVSPQGQTPREYLNSTTYENPSTPKPPAFTSKQPHQSSHYPRFVFPPNTPFQSSQNLKDGTEPVTAPVSVPASSTSRVQRSKPHFIFPHLPSPELESPNIGSPPKSIPKAFSPSAHRIRRDGQMHGSGTDFVGGGMAVEARGWVLEMVARVQQKSQLRETNKSNNLQESRDGHGNQSVNYSVTTGVHDARYGNVNAGGRGTTQMPITLVRPRHTHLEWSNVVNGPGPTADLSCQSLLLLGPPHSVQPSSTSQIGEGSRMREYSNLQEGGSVGVRKGFTWEIELGYHNNPSNGDVNRREGDLVLNSKDEEELSIKDARRGKGQPTAHGRWLVGAEWDVL